MKKRYWGIAATVVGIVAVLAVFAGRGQQAVTLGVVMTKAQVPDEGQPPLAAIIWRPEQQDGTARQPLIIISHGTGGSSSSHGDTAAALAKAGFVVVAIDHTGDNFRDTGSVGRGTHLVDRPRHISRTIDFMLNEWVDHAQIDVDRVGMFGHSAGGFTALVIAGAEPDLSRGATFCRDHPQSWTCRYVHRQGLSLGDLAKQRHIPWQHDGRVKAIAIAAPAIGYSFDATNLASVNIPVQLWAAEKDDIVDDSAELIRKALPIPPDHHAVQRVGHFSFLMPCNSTMRVVVTVMGWFGTEAVCDDPQGFNRQVFHQTYNEAIVQFFEATLRFTRR